MNLSKFDAILDKKLSPEWHLLEIETLSLELGAILDDISFLKVVILKSLQEHPDIIMNDAEYLGRFIEIANGNVPDPHYTDIPTSLELVFALVEMEEILGTVGNTPCLAEYTRYILNEEGHGEAYHPILSKFSGFVNVVNEKTKAANDYIAHMRGEK